MAKSPLIHPLARRIRRVSLCFRDRSHPSYAIDEKFSDSGLARFFETPSLDSLRADKESIAGVSNHYLDHRFDLLGSGWVQVKHGMACVGMEGHRYKAQSTARPMRDDSWLTTEINPANLAESQRLWRLIAWDNGKSYEPIDWHLDFKSGHRWDPLCWYRKISYGDKVGVDVKVPWELARMQHLPQLAWAYALSAAGEKDFATPGTYATEFRNEVLDFIATNPPRFGVNWRCAMDVAIRAANWLAAFDLFKAQGHRFDKEFEAAFSRSLLEHGRHIVLELEWHPQHRGNHYLSNIAGLLFIAAYLPKTEEMEQLLDFAIQGLIGEVSFQFNSDGSNFEGSTSYHRLSSELVLYATAITMALAREKRLPRMPFPVDYFSRLEKMAEFTCRVTKPNGRIVQIGDNDNGRFLKLQPVYRRLKVKEAKNRYENLKEYAALNDEDVFWDEDHLDHRHLVSSISGIIQKKDFTDFAGKSFESEIVNSLAQGPAVREEKTFSPQSVADSSAADWDALIRQLDISEENWTKVFEFMPSGGDLLSRGLQLYSYPDFGLYIFQSLRFFLSVRCGAIGRNGRGAHFHNDQLSIELNADGKDILADPGSYVYTALPGRRNQFRSVKAHFAPAVAQKEPGSLGQGLFSLADSANAKCLYFGKKGFIGTHGGYGHPVYRIVRLDSASLSIFDKTGNIKKDVPVSEINSSVPYSPGYGILLSK